VIFYIIILHHHHPFFTDIDKKLKHQERGARIHRMMDNNTPEQHNTTHVITPGKHTASATNKMEGAR